MTDSAYSKHGALRLLERGIEERHIKSVIWHGFIIARYNGKAMFALGRLRVVVGEKTGRIVTAWREIKKSVKRDMRKKRKRMKREWRRARGLV